jgi:putative ABC transport system ATP-binding protein
VNAPALEGRGLRQAFGLTPVLHGVDIAIHPGEILAVMGPSGSGKSTLLHLLAGLLRPAGGEVRLDGQRLDNLPERQRSAVRLAQLGFVFQFGNLVPELTLVENTELPLRLAGASARAARGRAMEMLGLLGIAAHAGKRLNQVSGGEAQRAAVARALVHRPRVILADEPTGALDTISGEIVLEALVTAAREQASAVVLVTHELKVAAWADRDIALRDGRIVGQREPAAAAGTGTVGP